MKTYTTSATVITCAVADSPVRYTLTVEHSTSAVTLARSAFSEQKDLATWPSWREAHDALSDAVEDPSRAIDATAVATAVASSLRDALHERMR